MAKTNKEEQSFVYQLGQDVAKLGFEIEKLKSKSVKAVRIVVPAKPYRYMAIQLTCSNQFTSRMSACDLYQISKR